MAVTDDTGGIFTLDETWQTIFDPEAFTKETPQSTITTIGLCTHQGCGCNGDVFVRVMPLHGPSDDGYALMSGHMEHFTLYPRGIGKIEAKGTLLGAEVLTMTVIARKTN